MDQERTTKKKKIKYFDDEFPKQEEILKISYEHSKRMREERLNKSPCLDLFNKIQAREK